MIHIRMFLTQALAVNGFPFEIKRANAYKALTEPEILAKLEKSREHAAQGMYKDATEVSRDMREKYGLLNSSHKGCRRGLGAFY